MITEVKPLRYMDLLHTALNSRSRMFRLSFVMALDIFDINDCYASKSVYASICLGIEQRVRLAMDLINDNAKAGLSDILNSVNE